MKYLVCGNGPSLTEQLRGKDISEYSVVRVNNWRTIEGSDNKCDVWCCYVKHALGEDESAYDFKPYLDKPTKEIWVPHVWTYNDAMRVLEGRSFRILSAVPFLSFIGEFHPHSPNTGTLAIFMAMVRTKFKEVIHIAGFDHYEGERLNYWSDDIISTSVIHNVKKDKKWIEKMIKDGRVVII